ncbi:PAS domain-containing protein [Euhalothece natronophila Z-M001]|uniref:PAS domain-containing protein n=1 Tax=Euhalothece natronophila Z-M001 TaxID=522448 RepID=A0A5B8NRC8_9CHRO|nr:histidine kinase dimerization/phosphoacceptor domain -containing protein [Euhalothece natronophila]QDZ41051.1 PAS domain-containing protein [Euhalothece natronophila Z-M001]
MDVNTLALVNSLREKISHLEQKQRENLKQQKADLQGEVKQYTEQLSQQAQGNRLLEEMVAEIRQSLDIKEILKTTAQQVKAFLNVEQVFIYHRVSPQQWELRAIASSDSQSKQGDITKELDKQFSDFEKNPKKIQDTSSEDIAKIIVPLEQGEQFWGVIYAYEQRQPRYWSELEIELLDRLAAQIAIALQQAQLYEKSQQAEAELKQFNQKLEEKVKKRTQQLEKANEQLQAVIDAVPGFISWIDSDLKYLGVNQRLAKALKMQPEEFIGKDIGFINHRQEFGGFIESFFQDSQQILSKTTIKNYVNGVPRYHLLVAQKYNQGKAAVSVGIDITERKQVEQQLHATTSRLITLIKNLQVGVVLQDRNLNVLLVNQPFCDLFDISVTPNELVGKSNYEFEEYYGELFQDQSNFEQRNQEILEANSLVTNEEWVLQNHKTLERDYIPVIVDNFHQGHLWMYRDITERKRYETELENSLQEKEMLLKEIHHRVKNNLLVVSNLLEFQSDYTDNPQVLSILEDSQNRVQSMALIHEKLYRSTGLNKIDFGEYLEALLENLFESYNITESRISLETEVDLIFLNIETANPCGLIVNELISNAFKHAFPDNRKGKIWLYLSQDSEKEVTLIVKDNGVGIPEELDITKLDSLGMELISTLTQQIKGNLEIKQDNGTTFILTFSERKYRKRY